MQIITVFEHQTIKLGQEFDRGEKLTERCLKDFQKYYGEKGVPYFSLTHNGIRFNEYVGVIQIGNTIVEVLPKADKPDNNDQEAKWRDILIHMLRAVGEFDIHAPSSSTLKLKPNSILDLYFELYIKEVEYLLNAGLVKQYRKVEGNVTSLKGNLLFGKHIQQNLTHQERFYVRHTAYDVEHKLHHILYKAIRLLKSINTNANLHSRIGSLMLHFPEMADISVSEAIFEKLVFNRKTYPYKKAIDIAKLLLLNYHPDVSKGRANVLALMFDMNILWERFVYISLRKNKPINTTITAQASKDFWKPENGHRSSTAIRPDIVVNKNSAECMVIDTKWKNLNGKNPSSEDLRQIYVYHEYYGAKRVALVYPGDAFHTKGSFVNPNLSNMEYTERMCSVISIEVMSDIKKWQKAIGSILISDLRTP